MTNDELIKELESIGYKRDNNSDFTMLYSDNTCLGEGIADGCIWFHLADGNGYKYWKFLYNLDDGNFDYYDNNSEHWVPIEEGLPLEAMILLYKDM